MLLEIRNVEKEKGNFRLKDISFSLPGGYIMGLIGQNGAGKTTLIRTILGLYQLDKGCIYIGGKDITEHEKEVNNKIGYVLAEESFLPELTLSRNAELIGKYYEKYEHQVFCAYCERFHLALDRKLKKLSRGEKLKFQMAFALAHAPELLILDEPTANFDPDFRTEFLAILSEFISDGRKSVLIATHIMEELEQLADYIVLMDDGKVILNIDREQMEEKYRVVTGEDYKCNLIDKERIIYKEKGEYSVKMLVHHSRFECYDKELQVEIPTIDDMMYYMIKGERMHG